MTRHTFEREGEESEERMIVDDRYDPLLQGTQSNDNNLSLLAKNVVSYQRAGARSYTSNRLLSHSRQLDIRVYY